MWIWLAVFVVLAIIEGVTYSLVSVWFCLGALAGLAAAALDAAVWDQILCCMLVSALTLCTLRPYMKSKVAPRLTKTNLDRLEGMTATVIEEVSTSAGAVKAGGTEWNARTSADGHILPVGEPCKIVRLDGNKLIVEPIITNKEENEL